MAVSLDLNLISLIAFYAILAVFLYVKRKKITVQSKILFLYKTERFNKLMRSIANKHPKFWRAFGLLSIPVGFGAMIFIFAYLSWKLVEMFFVPVPPIQIILPFTSTVSVGPILFISFWYFIISIFAVILVHEGAHGVVAEAFKQKIKSAGVGLAAIIPLAFVEPDEEKLQKAPTSTQLAIFSAGAMMNFVTAAIILLVSLFVVAPVVLAAVEPQGVEIYGLTNGFPAELAGLQVGDRIIAANGIAVSNPQEFSRIIGNLTPGDVISVETDRGTFDVTTIANPRDESQAHIGVAIRAADLQVKPELKERFGNLPLALLYIYNPLAANLPEQGLLQWIFVLNLGIGLINLLPLGAIDGGRMASIVLQRKIKDQAKAKRMFSIISTASILLIIFNIIGPYLVRTVM